MQQLSQGIAPGSSAIHRHSLAESSTVAHLTELPSPPQKMCCMKRKYPSCCITVQYLAKAGYGSRRDCQLLVEEGRVRVNGMSARSKAHVVDMYTDTVGLDWWGKLVDFCSAMPLSAAASLQVHGQQRFGTIRFRRGGSCSYSGLPHICLHLGEGHCGRFS